MIDKKPGWSYWKIAELIKENAIEIGDGYRAKNSEMGIPGLPFARAGNVNEGFHFKDADILSEVSVLKAKLSRKVSCPGDITFTSKGTFGRFAFVSADTPQFVYSPQLCYWRLKDKQRFDQRFLYYWMQGDDCLNQMIKLKGLTDMADYISLVNQRNMWLSAPSLPTQQKIATILSAYDDLIKNNTRRIKILDDLAQAIYREWFVNFRFPGHEGVQMVESELGLVPDGWLKQFRDFVDFLEGPGLRKWQFRDKGIPFLNIRTLISNDIDFSKLQYLDVEEVKQKYQHFLLKPFDHVVSSSGTIGRMVTIQKNHLPLMVNTSIIRMRPKTKSIDIWQLKHFLKSEYFQGQMNSYAIGSAQMNVGPVHLKQMNIIVPDEKLGQKYEQYVKPIEEMIISLAQKNANLRHTRDLLLPKLISGELDVNELDIEILAA